MKFIKLKNILFVLELMGNSYIQFSSDTNSTVEDERIMEYNISTRIHNTPIIEYMHNMLNIYYFANYFFNENGYFDHFRKTYPIIIDQLKNINLLLNNIYYKIQIDYLSINNTNPDLIQELKNQYNNKIKDNIETCSKSFGNIIRDNFHEFINQTISLKTPQKKDHTILLLSKIFLKYEQDFLSINQIFKDIIDIIPENYCADLNKSVEVFHHECTHNYEVKHIQLTTQIKSEKYRIKNFLTDKIVNSLNYWQGHLETSIEDFKETLAQKIQEDSELCQLFTPEEQQDILNQQIKEEKRKEKKLLDKNLQLQKQPEIEEDSDSTTQLNEQQNLTGLTIEKEQSKLSKGTIGAITAAAIVTLGGVYSLSNSSDDKQENQEESKENSQGQLFQLFDKKTKK